MNSKDKQLYVKCMELIKKRMEYIDSVMKGDHVLPSKLAKREFLFIQFRFIFETIAISTICGNRKLYEEIRASFHKERNATNIFKSVASVNPSFYPLPVRDIQKEDGRVHFEPIENGYLTLEELKKGIGICGNNLHTYNVYKGFSYEGEDKEIQRFNKWRGGLKKLLSQHMVYVHPGICLRVTMNTLPDGSVKAMEFELTSEKAKT